MRIGVIGVGGTGSAALRFLAESGHEAVGFEQFRIGHDRGSSHGASRIIRYTYPDPFYTRLMSEAYPLWEDLQRRAGEPLLVRCGGLFLGPKGHPELEAIERSLRREGHPFERLDAVETRARFPALRLAPGETAIFQAESGFLRPSACVRASARLAASLGATILEEARVIEIRPEGRRVRLVTASGSEHLLDGAIVSAGAWMGKVLSALRLPLRVTRQEVVHLEILRNESWFEPERFPVWIDAGTYDYGLPREGRVPGVKVAIHRRGEVCDPDEPDPGTREAYVRDRIAYAALRLPDLGSRVVHAETCLYTNTADEDFIVDRVPGLPNVWLVSGCSGHGFKFTVLLGKIAAELAAAAPCSLDLRRFALDRFGPPIESVAPK